MSWQETIKGKFQKVDLPGLSIQDIAKIILTNKGKDTSNTDDYLEYLLDEYYDEYFTVKDTLYRIIEREDLENCEFCEIDNNNDGTYSFITSFYNGGTHLIEMLQDKIKSL